MIYTSSYKAFNSYKLKKISISGNRGIDDNYKGLCYQKLAPKKSFWRIWKDNIDKVPEEENNRYYIREFWQEVLSKLDPEEVYNELNNSVLLCYEPYYLFCHRHIVAAWFEILLGIHVPEIIVNNSKLEEIEEVRRPSYIKEYLEEVMMENSDMKGYSSLRELYLCEKKIKGNKKELREQEQKEYVKTNKQM